MGTSRNYLNARSAIDRNRLIDAVASARMGRIDFGEPLPQDWPSPPSIKHPDRKGIESLLRKLNDDPSHPANWHKRAIAAELRSERVRDIYFRLRRALWLWREFAGLRPGARAILEAVIELAREEAFAWYIMVSAEHVRAIARLSEGRYATSVRELECLAITRPARIVSSTHFGPDDKATAEAFDRTATDGPMPIAQWVVRYRRGVPWNAKRAAWWLNYDLLCETGRVLDCYVVSPLTLSETYQQRNTPMGRVWPGEQSEDRIAATSRMLARRGPIPPAGFRAALWQLSRGRWSREPRGQPRNM